MKINELVEKYRQLRDKTAEIKERHKQELAPYNDAMEKIEAAVLKFLDETGQESARCDTGTAYIANRVSITVADGPAFRGFCEEQELPHLMETRPAKSAVEEWMQTNGGALPPGLNYSSERVVNFRKS